MHTFKELIYFQVQTLIFQEHVTPITFHTLVMLKVKLLEFSYRSQGRTSYIFTSTCSKPGDEFRGTANNVHTKINAHTINNARTKIMHTQKNIAHAQKLCAHKNFTHTKFSSTKILDP